MSRSWIILACIFSMLCMQAECWSYRYSNGVMTWNQARAWCQEHHTDLVTMKNQEEIDHLKMLLAPRGGSYWIGIRKIDNNWMWVGTNEPLTNEEANWGTGEPNDFRDPSYPNRREDCVQASFLSSRIFGKWNDLWCSRDNLALCYTASCQRNSCVHGRCVEIVNGYRCECFEGFYGDECQHAVQCTELTSPPKGDISCTDMYGNFAFDSLCWYFCEVGYELSDPKPLRCTATRNWSQSPPTCEAVQCPDPPHLYNGTVSCGDDPATRFSYGNNCTFSCQDGFELQGVVSMACTHSGEWNVAPPTCKESVSQLSAIVAGATIGGVVALSALSLLVWILLRRRREPADDLVMIINSGIEDPPAVQEGTDSPILDRDITVDLNNSDHEIIPKAE